MRRVCLFTFVFFHCVMFSFSQISVEQLDDSSFYDIAEGFSGDSIFTDDDPPYREERLIPQRKAGNEKKTSVYIHTDADSAEIYLNGQFYGYTPKTIENLREGRYSLRIEKQSYRTRRFSINVRYGEEQEYYIQMEQYFGYVSFAKTPEYAQVCVDGEIKTKTTEKISEGEHTVQFKLFGYETASADIYVFRRTHQVVTANLAPAAFRISDFEADKKSFNPALPAKIGEINFSFYVTNDSPATLKIFDRDGNAIMEKYYSGFRTWNQSASWSGKNSLGEPFPGGEYTAEISGGGQSRRLKFFIDNSLTLPAATLTAGGSGVGKVPCALTFPSDTFLINFTCMPNFVPGKMESLPFSLGIAYSLAEIIELSALGALVIKDGNLKPCFSLAAKMIFSKQQENFDFNFALLLDCNNLKKNGYELSFYNEGLCVEAGAIAGIDSPHFYAGLTTEYSFCNNSDADADSAWKNSAAFQLKWKFMTAGVFASFYLPLFSDDKPVQHDADGYWETGIDIIIPVQKSRWLINLSGGALFFQESAYFNCGAGITVIL